MLDGATIGVIAKRMCKRCGARRVSVCSLFVRERAEGSVGIFRTGRTQWKHLGEGMRVTGKRAAVGRVQVREVGVRVPWTGSKRNAYRSWRREVASNHAAVPGKGLVGARRSIFHGEGVAHS